MHTETEYLKTLAMEIAARPKTETQTIAADKHLTAEALRVKTIITSHLLHVDNFPQREIFYFNTLTKLVDICDILYTEAGTVSPDIVIILDLLTDIKKVVPSEISPNLPLAKGFIAQQSVPVQQRCQAQENIFKEQDIEPKLIDIATIPFKEFSNASRKTYWRNYTWLKGYEEKLNTIDWDNADCSSKTEALMSVLLSCDFNDDRFFIYCKKYVLDRTGRYGTRKRRLAEFAECEKLILQDTIGAFPPYNHRWSNISQKLVNWITIEVKTIKANDSFDEELYKIEYLWDVDSIALYHKYLMDNGITKKINTELYAKQIAATVSSIGKVEFKWETIHKRLYVKDQKSLRKIYEPLSAIVANVRLFLKL